MSLKRFSVEKQSAKESPQNNSFPHINLGDYEFSIEQVEGIEGTVVCTNKTVKDSSSSFTKGYSSYPFGTAMRYGYKAIPELNDILILGILCEAMCKAAIPINVLTENTELIEQFVEEALAYRKYTDADYHFALNRALELLKEPVAGDTVLKSIVLLGKGDDNSTICKATLNVCSSLICIIDEESVESAITIPFIVMPNDFREVNMNSILYFIIWFLLAKAGFYLDSKGHFCRFKHVSRHEFSPEIIFGKTIFDPYSVMEILTKSMPPRAPLPTKNPLPHNKSIKH